MKNLLDDILAAPGYFKQLRCADELVTEYNCPIKEQMLSADLAAEFGYNDLNVPLSAWVVEAVK